RWGGGGGAGRKGREAGGGGVVAVLARDRLQHGRRGGLPGLPGPGEGPGPPDDRPVGRGQVLLRDGGEVGEVGQGDHAALGEDPGEQAGGAGGFAGFQLFGAADAGGGAADRRGGGGGGGGAGGRSRWRGTGASAPGRISVASRGWRRAEVSAAPAYSR